MIRSIRTGNEELYEALSCQQEYAKNMEKNVSEIFGRYRIDIGIGSEHFFASSQW